MSKVEESKSKKGYLRYLGILLLVLGISFLVFTYFPAIRAYIDLMLFPPQVENITVEIAKEEEEITTEITRDTEVIFVNKDFGLYIPSIKANAKVIKNVDPYNEDTYRNALIYGVAHAKGTSLPNQTGNVFLFAHSTVNFYERRNYNIYFYLLGELKKEDEIYVSYEKSMYKYKVLDSKVVSPSEVKYLGKYMDQDTLTLMTCWPVGQNRRRMIVTAVRDTQ